MNEVMEILMDLRPDVDFEKEKALVDDEILDSFDIISLVQELDEEFDITIKPADLIPDNFNSAEAIWALDTYTPTKYNKAIEFANVFNYLFIEPYVKLTSKPFMKEHSFNTLILIGEPAFNPTGTKLVGLAAAGIKIHLTDINHLEPNNIYWLNDNILATLYHENAHT